MNRSPNLTPIRARSAFASTPRLTRFAVASILALSMLSGCSKDASQSKEDWVGAWATGQQLTEPHNNPPEPGLSGNTLRQNVFPTLSGDRMRMLFSNEWGDGPVTFQAVHLAKAGPADAIQPASDLALTFGGSASVTIPAGDKIYADTVDFAVQALERLAITIHFGAAPDNITGHPGSRTTSYIVPGDAVSAETLPAAAKTDHWYYISGIDVLAPSQSAAIVILGDSITDGRGTTTNGNNRWSDQLARRLQASADHKHISVINQGIGGNAIVAGGLGPTALERFERDVIQQPGVRWVIILEGVNDIGGSKDAEVADRLIEAYGTMIEAAHAKGLLVYGSPILPFGESFYDSALHAAARLKVNKWIRESGRFDAVIDLDKAVAIPDSPNKLRPEYDTGDHLHLSPAGYEAMAQAIDLSLFEN